MKFKTNLDFESGSTSRLAHRVFLSRFDTQKTPAHRYERRKVREYLRQADSMVNAGSSTQ